MKKIMIVGASILQLPAILKARELGLTIGVADRDPQAIGVSYADHFFNVSTIDEEGILEAAQMFRPDGVITLATDMPMRAVARATTELGLPGISIQAALKSTDKGEMMKAFQQAAVESPWFYILDTAERFDALKQSFSYPCLLKPTDSSGSRGVIVVQQPDELDAAYAYSRSHSQAGGVIVEELMTGSEVSVEAMVIAGQVHILAVTDKLTTGAPYFVEMGHSQPSDLPENDLMKINDLASRAIHALGIDLGPVHVEIMLTKVGPKMIELGARMGGDNITTHLVPLSTGIDMVKATIELAIGKLPDLSPKLRKGSAIRYLDLPNGVITSIAGIEEALQMDGVKEVTITKKIGERVGTIQSSSDRAGYVIAQGENLSEVIDRCHVASGTIRIVIS